MSSRVQVQVSASEVAEGDFLPGFGHGYVFQDAEPDPDVRDGYHNTSLGGEGYVLLTFHDEHGDENYALLAGDMQVTVEREA